jgi:hypothetical protein
VTRLDRTDFVLLGCQFSLASSDQSSEGEPAVHGEASHGDFGEPERLLTLALDDVNLAYGASRDGDEFRLVIEASRPDTPISRGFMLAITAGARFETDAPPELTAEFAESTLLFISYPYLRELVFSLTGRSSVGPIRLAPLTRLPAPSMWDVVTEPREPTEPSDAIPPEAHE